MPFDIASLTEEQRSELLAQLTPTSVAAEMSAPEPEPTKTDTVSVTLQDLLDDPMLLQTMTPEQAYAVYLDAENTAGAIAGTLFQQLHAASADVRTTKEETVS